MNPNLHHLFAIAQKPVRSIIGLMSGTSLDGLDVALCHFRGSGTTTQVQVAQFTTVPYTEEVKTEIRRVFAKSEIDFEHLCLLNPWIGLLHADMVLACLREWQLSPTEVDCIASHGQTVFHAPQRQHGHPSFPNATLQIGDGDHVAVRSGILTISDFRQKHIAAGGEGAPLAAYGDYLLLSKAGEDRILLNMGGIANFTYLPGSLDTSKVFATDVGTGNTLLDAFTRHFFPEKSFDANGDLAAQGHVHEALLADLLANPFFAADFPKTTGPELFSMAYVAAAQQRTQTTDLSPFDLLATLTQFSAEGIIQAIERCAPTLPAANLAIYASGGGTYNTVLMNTLRKRLPRFAFGTTADLGIHPDAKEAVLFATLANECLVGNPAAQPSQPGSPAVSMGKISFAQ
ncbi:anhydro-N-acetylmuramic acid kinase [Hymenobacter crusticola]|uniref:Anhydro-N-acetylmuramic acid kinase n=1 Tax=Hymenobacter crusticola TaxID=1770526 RepID=A0A243WCH5_9BACT|nr:anhydro-N-acetylmuramic acid kinase [Hymenobacter crusticola]OUJ72717.1 anhydro-N-acetylmuramic acid kinase [Hymenobacter crusticola]